MKKKEEKLRRDIGYSYRRWRALILLGNEEGVASEAVGISTGGCD